MITLAVLKVPENWRPSKFNDALTKRVTFEDIDSPKTYYYLNLTQNCEPQKWQQWQPYLKPGNLLEVTLQPGTKNVNQFAPFRVKQIKEANK